MVGSESGSQVCTTVQNFISRAKRREVDPQLASSVDSHMIQLRIRQFQGHPPPYHKAVVVDRPPSVSPAMQGHYLLELRGNRSTTFNQSGELPEFTIRLRSKNSEKYSATTDDMKRGRHKSYSLPSSPCLK
ncbi:hypothetical protein SAY87_000287 [Trapa incisa]|uniref:Uncharacterized protein n=1 Tax=Trapa incisa TaxID=236973 RepID=A0AAN7GBU3_9MYRT|nr:hypothetical protein SAY87_000287 [Trapa incisa]